MAGDAATGWAERSDAGDQQRRDTDPRSGVASAHDSADCELGPGAACARADAGNDAPTARSGADAATCRDAAPSADATAGAYTRGADAFARATPIDADRPHGDVAGELSLADVLIADRDVCRSVGAADSAAHPPRWRCASSGVAREVRKSIPPAPAVKHAVAEEPPQSAKRAALLCGGTRSARTGQAHGSGQGIGPSDQKRSRPSPAAVATPAPAVVPAPSSLHRRFPFPIPARDQAAADRQTGQNGGDSDDCAGSVCRHVIRGSADAGWDVPVATDAPETGSDRRCASRRKQECGSGQSNSDKQSLGKRGQSGSGKVRRSRKASGGCGSVAVEKPAEKVAAENRRWKNRRWKSGSGKARRGQAGPGASGA